MIALTVLLLPSLHRASAGDVRRLTGPEVAALTLAVGDFRAKRFSKIGDLKHYDVEVKRSGDTVDVAFYPQQKKHFAPGEAGTGGGTIYGDEVHIFVSLKRMKILRYQFAR